MEITVAIPVFNEESILVANTRRLCQYLEAFSSFEILLLCNGCTDASVSLARELQDSELPVRVFTLAERNVAGAFRLALNEARAGLLISMDMDLSADLSFLRTAFQGRDEFELLVGSKKLGEDHRSWVRRMGSDLYIWGARRLMEVNDYSMGAKAYQVEFFRPLATRLGPGTCYVVESIYLAKLLGARVVETPVLCRDNRSSRFNLPAEAILKFAHLATLYFRDGARRREVRRLVRQLHEAAPTAPTSPIRVRDSERVPAALRSKVAERLSE